MLRWIFFVRQVPGRRSPIINTLHSVVTGQGYVTITNDPEHRLACFNTCANSENYTTKEPAELADNPMTVNGYTWLKFRQN